MKEQSLPALLIRNAEKYGDKVALREKEYGIWSEITWSEYLENVKYFSLGFIELGLEKGARVAIMGDNRPEWLYSELACQSVGGIPVGIFEDALVNEVEYILNDSEVEIVVAIDQEQVDKVLSLQKKLPSIKAVVYTEPEGLHNYDNSLLMHSDKLIEIGKRLGKKNPDLFETSVFSLTEDDIALLSYTSGTTGTPKGALMSYGNILRPTENFNKVNPKFPDDEFLSFLPLPWAGEQYMAVFSSLVSGFTINFPEEPETALADLYEIGATLMFAPPKFWEKFCSTVQVAHLDASYFKRLAYRICLPIGYGWANFKFEKKKPPLYWKLIYGISYLLLFRAMRDRLGLSKVRSALTGGGLLAPEIFSFFHALGVNLKQMLGITELSGVLAIHRDDDISPDTIGPPTPDTNFKFSDDGEILISTPGLFKGYYKNPQKTQEAVVDNKWFKTGDSGYMTEEGHLVIVDRVAHLMKKSDGTKFSPLFIETKLNFSPYIVQAMVIGHERPFVSAIICIDFANVGKWAEDHQLGYTTYTDLASKKEVCDLIEWEVYQTNKRIPEEMHIQSFLLLYKELDPDDGELTRTRKLKRHVVLERYLKEIDALYGEENAITIDSEVQYKDGTKKRIQASLQIRRMKQMQAYKRREAKGLRKLIKAIFS